MLAAGAEIIGDDLPAVRQADHVACGPESVFAPQPGEPCAVAVERPGPHHPIRRVISDHNASGLIHQRWIRHTASRHTADINGLSVAAVLQADADQSVCRAAHSAADHGGQVPVLPVVHEPGLPQPQHHIPAVGLRRAGGVIEAPTRVAHQRAGILIPVEAEDTAHTNHVQPVAHCAQPGDGRLRAFDVRAGGHQGIGLKDGKPCRVALRDVLRHDQPVVQDDEAVVRQVQWQLQCVLHAAVPRETMCPPPVDDIDVTIRVQRHAAGPHRTAAQQWRLLLWRQRYRINQRHSA